MTFEEAMEYTRLVGSHASYQEDELLALWEGLEATGRTRAFYTSFNIVEIGCEYGRSTSLILKWGRGNLVVIDPFQGGAVAGRFLYGMADLRSPFTLMCMTSAQARVHVIHMMGLVDFLHIDGDHEEAALRYDCDNYIPLVISGGIVAFHDYGCTGLKHVKLIVDRYVKGWEIISHRGNCLVVRKP